MCRYLYKSVYNHLNSSCYTRRVIIYSIRLNKFKKGENLIVSENKIFLSCVCNVFIWKVSIKALRSLLCVNVTSHL